MDAAGESERMQRVVVVGGGIAGVEAAMALGAHLRGWTDLTLISPEPELLIKPLLVEEPFGGEPAERHALLPLLAEVGVSFVERAVLEVRPREGRMVLDKGKEIEYDYAIVCVGGRAIDPYRQATTFWAGRADVAVDELILRAARSRRGNLALLAPSSIRWVLPLYEIALLARRRADQLGCGELAIELFTPEPSPLSIFGKEPSETVSSLLAARRIVVHPGSDVVEDDVGALSLGRGGPAVLAGAYIALPRIVGPRVPGLPADEDGFIPIDRHGQVRGIDRVYAAGDGTDFPIKQGGLAAQQADVAAEHVAAQLGAEVEATPLEPVLRGQLIVGGESLNLLHEIGGPGAAGQSSLDYMWWPSTKLSARYLSAKLAKTEPRPNPGGASRRVAVEAAWPHDWHGEPLDSW